MTIIQTPMEYTAADHIDLSKEDSGVFWKQIIPLDKEIVYGDKKIKFDKNFLTEVKKAFDNKVLDQTAFQLANDNNQHDTPGVPLTQNFDPRRYSGDLTQLIINNRGLYGQFRLTKEGAELIKNNPKLGVSASLKPNYVDANGKTHPIVMRHVLGTLDPKIKGMSPWSKDDISLSVFDELDEEVIDLAAADTDTPPNTSEEAKGGEKNNGGAETVTVNKSDYDAMKTQIDEFSKGEDLLNEILAETESDDKVSLSQEEPEDPRILELRQKVAASDWKAEKGEWIQKGVPASMVNLAEGILSSPDDFTINLSNGESADPRETIRGLLHEAEGQVDLSAESGHGMSADEKEKEKSKRDSFVDDFMNDLF